MKQLLATLRAVLDRLTADDFAPLVGERFELLLPEGEPLELRLTSCDELGGAPEGARRPFSLIFHGDRLVPQQIWTLRHPQLGELELFIVPLGPEEGGMRYEAIFT